MSPQKSRHDQIRRAAEQDLKRRRRERIAIVIFGVALLGLFALVVRFSRLAEQSPLLQPSIIYFFNFAIWSLILVLSLVLVFLIVRNVAKFVFERRRGVLGAKLRIRLVIAFITLTVGPATVLFLLSTFILNNSIEQLYSPHSRNLVETSKRVLDSSTRTNEAARKIMEWKYEADGEQAQHFAQELARAIVERGWVKLVAESAGGAGASESVEKKGPVWSSTWPAGAGVSEAGRKPADAVVGAGAASAQAGAPGEEDEPEEEFWPRLDPFSREVLTGDRGGERYALESEVYSFFEYKRQEYELAVAELYDRSGRRLMRSAKKDPSFPPVEKEHLKNTLAGGQGYYLPAPRSEGGAFIYALYPVPLAAGEEKTEIVGAVMAGRSIDWIQVKEDDLKTVSEDLRLMIKEYELFSQSEQPVSMSYYFLLILVTLILIFLAVWFGFYLAKGITEPIQLLAEGTEMVASGNLDYRIEVAAEGDDEIAILVRSFNKMTGDLALSRHDLDHAYQSLAATNLELEQRRRYMETVLAQVTTGVISVDHAGSISTVNATALRMLGKQSKEEALGQPLALALHPDSFATYLSLGAELKESGAEIAQRQITVVRDERTFVVLVSVAPLLDEKGDPLGTVIMIEDLTDLIKAHRAMAWREVARRIAHEIKNPLTPIQLAAQRLERRYAGALQGEDAEVFRQSVRTIIDQVEEMRRLVNEFSLFARLPATNPAPQNLAVIVAEVVPLFREAHSRIEFEVIEDPRLPLIELDADQMKRVLVNLLDNAVASIDGPGKVTLETMYNDKLQIVRLEVRDTGHGIPPHARDRLFEPYYSTKPHGSGLGLTIVQRIIADHYGYIRVADNKPRGAVMIIELPVVLTQRRLGAEGVARAM